MSLKSFFNPQSIAIVGVSTHPEKVGYLVARNMIDQGYAGKLYFVHPSGETILGHQTTPDLKSIGKQIDLVIFAIPADAILPYLEKVAEVGCKNVLVYAAGFKENHTEAGDAREKKLQDAAKKYGLTVLGPNCIGYVNTERGINATFLKSTVPHGNIGIISQSGALGSAITDYYSAQKNLGLSFFISLGNKAIIDESVTLEYLAQDPATAVIGMYLEDVADGARFQAVLEKTTAKKPVIILKSGRTTVGSEAAVSHTGSMVGDDAVFEAAIRQSGAIRTYTFSHFQEVIRLFSFDQIPTSRNILVLSNAGGMGVMLADELIEQNLQLVTVSEKTKKKLYGAFDEFKKITVHNPIDLLGDASAFDYEKAVRLTMQEYDVGGTMVLLTPQANTQIMETAKVLVEAHKKKLKRPIYPVFMGGSSVKPAHTYFEENKLASFRYFSELPPVMRKINDSREYIAERLKESPVQDVNISLSTHALDIKEVLLSKGDKQFLNQHESLRVLGYSGIQVAKPYLATSEHDLKMILENEGYPLVAKIASDKITHKTEVKGVITGLNTWDELVDAYEAMIRLSGPKNGCYIQKQYSGHEFILGAKRDPTFGIVLMIGLGGIYAELLKETVNLVYPYPFVYLRRELRKSKMKKLLDGYRKSAPIPVEGLHTILSRIGRLMEQFSTITEIDINPLIATGDELIAVDGRIII